MEVVVGTSSLLETITSVDPTVVSIESAAEASDLSLPPQDAKEIIEAATPT